MKIKIKRISTYLLAILLFSQAGRVASDPLDGSNAAWIGLGLDAVTLVSLGFLTGYFKALANNGHSDPIKKILPFYWAYDQKRN